MDKVASPAGIARSLTNRMNRNKSVTDGSKNTGHGLGRAFSMKRPEKPAPRPEISLPIELISATNLLAYNAPDIPDIRNQVSPASNASPVARQLTAVSSNVSLRSEGSVPALSSAASTTFSGISTPTDELPEQHAHDPQNRMTSLPETGDETQAQDKAKSPVEQTSSSSTTAPPAIPKRAPSHTKKSHQAFARQRSVSRMRSESSTAASTPSLSGDNVSRNSTSSSRHLSTHSSKEPAVARSSADMFSPRTHVSGSSAIDISHPFGAELAKLTEVAEEFSPRRAKAQSPPPRPQTRSSEDSDPRSAMPTTPKTPASTKDVFRQKRHIELTIWDEEQEYLSKHGLKMFSAEDYMAEIGSPYTSSFTTAVF